MTRPILSVLIDTYNHERYIEQAIVSAIEQDFPASDYEILVVDDGSTDRTPEIVRKFEPRVQLLRKPNGGQASAFNAGVAAAKSEIVAFLDGDDWFAPGKLSAVLNVLELHPELGAVGHGYYEFDQATCKAQIRAPSQEGSVDLSTSKVARQYCAWLWAYVLMGALTIRKEAARKVMPIPEKLRFRADVPVAIAALASGAYILRQPLFYYRQHGANLFSASAGSNDWRRQNDEIAERVAQAVEDFIPRLNIPPDSAEVLLEKYKLDCEERRFSQETPGRTEFFRFLLRANRCHAQQTWKLAAIRRLNAIASLATGYKHFATLNAFWQTLDRAKDGLTSLHQNRFGN